MKPQAPDPVDETTAEAAWQVAMKADPINMGLRGHHDSFIAGWNASRASTGDVIPPMLVCDNCGLHFRGQPGERCNVLSQGKRCQGHLRAEVSIPVAVLREHRTGRRPGIPNCCSCGHRFSRAGAESLFDVYLAHLQEEAIRG